MPGPQPAPTTFEAPPLGAPPPGFPGSQTNEPVPLAGFGARLVAYLLDGFIGTLLMTLAAIPLILWASGRYETVLEPCKDGSGVCETPTDEAVTAILIAFAIGFLLSVIIAFVYYVVLVSRSGRTPGKRIMGLQIVNANTGQPPSFGSALLRWVMMGLPIIGPIGLIWILVDDRNQGLHDKASNTFVIKH